MHNTNKPDGSATGTPELAKVTPIRPEGQAVEETDDGGSQEKEALLALGAPADYVIPPPWQVSLVRGKGIVKEDKGVLKAVATEPVIVTARYVNETTLEASLELTWLYDGALHTVVESKGVLRSNRKIVDRLAGLAFPVSTGNAAAVVAYLEAVETANLDLLPLKRLTSQAGWIGENHDDFLYEKRADIGFQSAGKEEERVFSAFRRAGSAETWQASMVRLKAFPRAAIGLYASLAAPLLSIFNVDPFTVDIAGPTSSGKTTALHLGASVWGEPDGLTSSWNTTLVAIEQRLAMLNGLPCFLNESQLVKEDKTIQDALYLLAEGQGRSRGAKTGGMAFTQRWSAIGFSTGERQLTEWTEEGGTAARILSLWGKPFGEEPQTELVAELKRTIADNYGHAGPAFVRDLMDKRHLWPKWREKFGDMVRDLEAKVDEPIAQRRARYVALLALAAGRAEACGVMAWKPSPAFWEALLLETVTEEDDKPAKALRHVWSWATANTEKFWSINRQSQFEPHGGWLGRWSGSQDVEWIAVQPAALKAVLKSGDFNNYEATLKIWGQKGWVIKSKDGKNSRQRRIGPNNDRLVHIRISEALRLVGPE